MTSAASGPRLQATNAPQMDEEISKAIEFLIHSAGDIGRAKERAERAGKMIGHIEALMAKASDEKSADARKMEARASDKYLDAINECAEAEGEMAKLYSLRQAATMKIEAWRTFCATQRSYRG